MLREEMGIIGTGESFSKLRGDTCEKVRGVRRL